MIFEWFLLIVIWNGSVLDMTPIHEPVPLKECIDLKKEVESNYWQDPQHKNEIGTQFICWPNQTNKKDL